MAIFNMSDEPIVSGIKLVQNFSLLKPYTGLGLPKGVLMVIDGSGGNLPIGRYDFENNRDLELIYVEESELG
jgi:hypothetical protein